MIDNRYRDAAQKAGLEMHTVHVGAPGYECQVRSVETGDNGFRAYESAWFNDVDEAWKIACQENELQL